MSELINPSEFGIETKQANEIIGNLPQIKAERSMLEKQYEEIIKLDIEDIETTKRAKELRLLIVKNRTQGINVWHKTTKDFFLKGGQFVDAIKRLEIGINERMEQTLEKIEKHFEIKEMQRIEQLRQQRLQELETYIDFVPTLNNLGSMSDGEYKIIYNGAKLQYEAKIEQERIAEEKRQAEIKLLKEFQDRQAELLPYKFFAETNIEIGMSEDKYLELLNNAKKSKHEYDLEMENKRKENELLIKKHKEEEKKRKLIEEQLKAKEYAERKERERLEAEKQAELNKSDVNKVADLINELTSIKTKYQFKSKANQKMYQSTCVLIDKTIDFINNLK